MLMKVCGLKKKKASEDWEFLSFWQTYIEYNHTNFTVSQLKTFQNYSYLVTTKQIQNCQRYSVELQLLKVLHTYFIFVKRRK